LDFTYPKNLRFECSRCGLCCGDTPQKTRRILLLPKEAQEIAAATNQLPNSFVVTVEGNAPYMLEMKKTEGKCVFLKNNQCTIYQQRPLICRFYPFELKTENNQHIFGVTLECPAIGQGQKRYKSYFDALFELAQEKLQES
jgi:Fe-S-cluster containining protein